MNILDTIKSSDDIKKLSIDDLDALCSQIREFLVKNVSHTGGHLSSNLGVVEITVALHKVFDFPQDKIIFDVGHQSYVHKIITGRKDKFQTLRCEGGISGFPKRNESEYDSFNTGHASTSISAALGMARSRDLRGENNNIIALFGDGALTGGMMFEAMNDAGGKKTPLILILNDNTMSISKNVGSISAHLREIRSSDAYLKSKKAIEEILNKIPFLGSTIAKIIKQIKRIIRRSVISATLFDDLGFEYLGPIDGHDIQSLIKCFQRAKKTDKPILLHIKTIKGKGYAPAEKYPAKFHGVGKFDPETGQIFDSNDCYSECFGEMLCKIAKDNPDVCAITAAMPYGTGLSHFQMQYPERFFDVGIAEEHATTLAAGISANGLTPVLTIYSSFLQRAYDQILHDICLQNLHVVLAVDRAGIVGADGETHQGLYDISFLSHIPNMAILSPSSYLMLQDMLAYAILEHNGPIAIRYPRGNTQFESEHRFKFGKTIQHSFGNNLTILATGRMVQRAFEVASLLEYYCDIIEIPTIKPLDINPIIESIKKTSAVITIEDGAKSGGMGQYISSKLYEKGVFSMFYSFAFPDTPISHGSIDKLDKKFGLDVDSIVDFVKEKIVR